MRSMLFVLLALALTGCVADRELVRQEETTRVEAFGNRRLLEENIRRQGCLLERTPFARALCFERVRTF